MKKLKIKPSYWILNYTKGRSAKQHTKMLVAHSLYDVFSQFNENPNFYDCEICAITKLIDERCDFDVRI